jgi:hypothetical protein
MNEFNYVARASIRKVAGTHRQATLEEGTVVDFGVHGAIKAHFGLENEKNLPLPVDYMVAATGG